MRLANLIKAWRLRQEPPISARQMARRLGLDAATYCRFESGENISQETYTIVLHWATGKWSDEQ